VSTGQKGAKSAYNCPKRYVNMGFRTHGQMVSADPPGKMDEKLKSENMQKRVVFYVYVIF